MFKVNVFDGEHIIKDEGELYEFVVDYTSDHNLAAIVEAWAYEAKDMIGEKFVEFDFSVEVI